MRTEKNVTDRRLAAEGAQCVLVLGKEDLIPHIVDIQRYARTHKACSSDFDHDGFIILWVVFEDDPDKMVHRTPSDALSHALRERYATAIH